MPGLPIPRRLLYIEGHNESKLLVSRLLEAAGTETICCNDGIRGLELAQTKRPDFVLVDLNLPLMDGYETATRLKAAFRRSGVSRVPVIATSIYALHDDRDMALAAGCDGFMAKPVEVDTFLETVSRYYTGGTDTMSPEREKAALIRYHRRLVEKLETREAAILLDESTDLYNETYLYSRLEEEASRTLRRGKPFSVALISVQLQSPRDEAEAFEEKAPVHRAIAEIIRANKRAYDAAHKMNGDAYCLILVDTSREPAKVAAHRISLRIVERLPNLSGARVSLLMGLNTYVSGPLVPRDFIRKASEGLMPFQP